MLNEIEKKIIVPMSVKLVLKCTRGSIDNESLQQKNSSDTFLKEEL